MFQQLVLESSPVDVQHNMRVIVPVAESVLHLPCVERAPQVDDGADKVRILVVLPCDKGVGIRQQTVLHDAQQIARGRRVEKLVSLHDYSTSRICARRAFALASLAAARRLNTMLTISDAWSDSFAWSASRV